MGDVLHLIFWVLVLLLALSFFGISVQAIVTSPAGQANFAYVYHLLSQAWDWISLFSQSVITFVGNLS